ncbi:MAG: hypothetical protein M0P31_14230 [Solirubrobacteraceae bacterium]|nr:hypothetical protein [Solirubrobacteraceae bacterium]
MSAVLAAATPTSFSVWLILLWLVIIPGFAIVPLLFTFSQVAGEHRQNQAYARGERPADDPDQIVVDA